MARIMRADMNQRAAGLVTVVQTAGKRLVSCETHLNQGAGLATKVLVSPMSDQHLAFLPESFGTI
jgi:hypothetical protein